jgi:hypothetical protein
MGSWKMEISWKWQLPRKALKKAAFKGDNLKEWKKALKARCALSLGPPLLMALIRTFPERSNFQALFPLFPLAAFLYIRLTYLLTRLNPKDEGDRFFQNVGNHLQDYTVW